MRNRTFGLLLCIATALAACNGADTPAESGAPAPTPPPVSIASTAASADAVAACPDADFDAFLKRFEASVDAQRKATADPLTMTRIDPDADPEPATVIEQVPLAKVEFPVMVDGAARQAEGSEVRIESRGEIARDVTVRRPDSDAQVHFEFEKTPCWTLVRVSDESI